MNVDQQSGSPEAWDSVWRSYAEAENDRACLYVRGKPRTLLQFWQRCYAEDLERFISGHGKRRLLELGSGRATTSMYLRSYGHDDITIVDRSETALHMAARNFEMQGMAAPKLTTADVADTGLPADHFDAIYNIGLLEHFDDPAPVLAESYRLLAPGGSIFMPIVPELGGWKGRPQRAILAPWTAPIDIARALVRRRPATTNAEDAFRATSQPSHYSDAAARAGFDNVSCCPYNPYWNVTALDGAYERNCIVPLYTLHYRVARSVRRPLALATSSAFGKCYLLTATKPAKNPNA